MMIIVCGFCRTGTSILMQCLKDSGFNPGDKIVKPKDWPYLAVPDSLDCNNPNLRIIWNQQFFEHPSWNIMNYFISRDIGAEIKTTKRGKWLILALSRELSLSSGIHNMMVRTKRYFETSNINILKDPWGAFALRSWIKGFKLFESAKYIWTKRDPIKRAKSQVREQLGGRDPDLKGFLTTSKAIEIGQNHNQEIARVMPLVDHVEIWLEDILGKTKEMGDKLSDFIGKKIDMSAISKSEVWAGKPASKN